MSTISFICTECHVQVEAQVDRGGDTSICPNCDSTILIPMPGIETGSKIAGFEILHRIGVGGMGEVWLAHQTSMGRDIAIKILAPALANDPTFVESFLHEVKIVAKLSHPNIVVAHDAGHSDGVYYMAISFVDGEEVEEVLEREGVMEEEQALDVTKQIADALGYAWDKFKMIHRDVKPANIMIDKDGVAKLMDMGISKTMSEGDHLNSSGYVFGTPHYMSPEQSRNDQGLDFRTDLYSLGVTLYHMLAGAVPFTSSNVQHILHMHISEPLKPLRKVNPKISKRTANLVETMMEKDPENRHDSWAQVIEEIDKILTNKDDKTKPIKKNHRVFHVSHHENESIGAHSLEDTQVSLPGEGSAVSKHKLLLIIGLCVVMLLGAAVGYLKLSRSPKETVNSEPAPTIQLEDIKTTAEELAQNQEAAKEHELATKRKAHQAKRDKVWSRLESAFNEANRDANKLNNAWESLRQYQKVIKTGEERRRAKKIEKLINQLQTKGVAKVLSDLEVEASTFIKANNYNRAIVIFRDYNRTFKNETLERRSTRVKELEAKRANFDKRRNRDIIQKRNRVIGLLCTLIFQGKLSDAVKLSDRSITDKALGNHSYNFTELSKQIKELATAEDKIEINLKKLRGQKLSLPYEGETIKAELTEVNNGLLEAFQKFSSGARRGVEIKISDLPLQLKIQHLGPMSNEGKHLYAALGYAKRGKDSLAKIEFTRSGPLGLFLATHQALRGKVSAMLQLASLGSADLIQEDNLKTTLKKKQLSSKKASKILALVTDFYAQHKEETAYHPLVDHISRCAFKAFPSSKIFQGKVIELNLKNCYVHLRFEFDHPDELRDFEAIKNLDFEQEMAVKDHKLILGSTKHASMVFKPIFRSFEANYRGIIGNGDFDNLLKNSKNNLIFVASGLPNFDGKPRDGFISGWRNFGSNKGEKEKKSRKDDREGLNREISVQQNEMVYMKGDPTKFKPGQHCNGHMIMKNKECTLNINGQIWKARALNDYSKSQFGFCTYKSTSIYEFLEIKGTLDLAWLKKAFIQAGRR